MASLNSDFTALGLSGVALGAASGAAVTEITKSLDAVACSALVSKDRPSSIASRHVHSRMRRFATRAKLCVDQLRTSDPSRAGILICQAAICQAAGLLRRQHCGRMRAADAPPATEPLSPVAGRAPGLCASTTRGDFRTSRPDIANHPKPLSLRPAGRALASCASVAALPFHGAAPPSPTSPERVRVLACRTQYQMANRDRGRSRAERIFRPPPGESDVCTRDVDHANQPTSRQLARPYSDASTCSWIERS